MVAVDFSGWIKKVFGSSLEAEDDSLGPPIEDYLKCESNCECPKVPDANGVMRNHEAEYAAGMSAGRWIREQQIVRSLRIKAMTLIGDARQEMLSMADEIEGNR
jgi:hypothetical protein